MSKNPIYNKVSKNSKIGTFLLGGKFPLNVNTVKISLEDLTNYIKDKESNAYPGMLIAVDDDMTNDGAGNVETSSERGIYYITRNRDDSNNFVALKLAYEKDLTNTENSFSEKLAQLESSLNLTINNSVDPLVQILNIMLANYCPWEELYEVEGRETGSNPVVSINEIQNQAINGRIYRIEPIYKETDDLIHKNWGDNNWNWSDD